MANKDKNLHAFLTSARGLTILVICIAVFLSLYLMISTTIKSGGQANEAITPSTTAAITPANSQLITTDIYFLKNPTSNTVSINVKTGKQPISSIQLALSYNPSLISNISITPGDFFDNPTVLQNSIDTAHGIIYYTLSINPTSAQIYGEGTIAILHFGSIPTGISTIVSVLPQTKIISKGINDVLWKATPITFP